MQLRERVGVVAQEGRSEALDARDGDAGEGVERFQVPEDLARVGRPDLI